ncbi:MAG: hypothetical protein K6G81_07635, partial [Lachnospiraceae bacterium]|nr:hypothetical protein [Lachnospiraceae bacterium]
YEGAANGLTPTGEILALDGVKNKDLIQDVLTELGLDGKYSVESIQDSLDVKASYPDDVLARVQAYNSLYDFSASRDVQQENFYPTIVGITLYDDFDTSISEADMRKLLSTLAESYRSRFLKDNVFAYSRAVTEDILDVTDADYRYQLDIIKKQLNIIGRYAGELYESNISFSHNGISFNDLSLKCQSIIDNELSNLEALIILNSYSKSPVRLRNQYQYEIGLLTNELEQKQTNLEELDALVASYEMDDILYIPMGDSYVRVDSNSTEVYEELMDKKQELTDRITTLNSNIAIYNQYITDLNIATSPRESKDLQNKLTAASEKLVTIEDEFSSMLKAFTESVITEDNIIIERLRFVSPSLFSFSFIARAVKCALPVCLCTLLLFFGFMIFHEMKRLKNGEAF